MADKVFTLKSIALHYIAHLSMSHFQEWLYWLRNWCRRMFALAGLLALAIFAYNYRDLNAANNKLLIEIRKQNSDLKHLLHGQFLQLSVVVQMYLMLDVQFYWILCLYENGGIGYSVFVKMGERDLFLYNLLVFCGSFCWWWRRGGRGFFFS